MGELPPHLGLAELIDTIRGRWGPGVYLAYAVSLKTGRRTTWQEVTVGPEPRFQGMGIYDRSAEGGSEGQVLNEVTRLLRRQIDQLNDRDERVRDDQSEVARQRESSGAAIFGQFMEFMQARDAADRAHSERMAERRAQAALEIETERQRMQQEREAVREDRSRQQLEAVELRFQTMLERTEARYERERATLLDEIRSLKETMDTARRFDLSAEIAEEALKRQLDAQFPKVGSFERLVEQWVAPAIELFGQLREMNILAAGNGSSVAPRPGLTVTQDEPTAAPSPSPSRPRAIMGPADPTAQPGPPADEPPPPPGDVTI